MTIDVQLLISVIGIIGSIITVYIKLLVRVVKIEASIEKFDEAVKRLDKVTDQLAVMWAMLPGGNERPSDRIRRAATDG